MYNIDMAIALDNIHYSYRSIDGYNKPFNFIMSPREPGKTSMAWLKKIYLPWKQNKRPWIYFTRTTVEITEALIVSIQDTIINKFTDDNVKFEFKTASFKDGIVDIKINGEVFFRIVSLSIPLRRIKLAVLKRIAGVLMDEYIIDPRTGETYQKNEAFKIKEAYTTWRREAEGFLKFYFLANPYSLFNPLFIDWGVDVNKLRKDSFYVGDMFVIHWAVLSPELKAHLLEVNPLYQFDEDYNQYALEGTAINDRNIKITEFPQNYYLKFVFRIDNKFIGVFKNNFVEDHEDKYYCKFLDSIGAHRTAFCFDFNELVDRCCLIGRDERNYLDHFKMAMRKRAIAFSDINVYYFIEEIYKNL